MSKYTRIENLKDIIMLPTGYVRRDFYTSLVEDGKRESLICSFRRGEYVPFENIESLQRRVNRGRIYVNSDFRNIKKIPDNLPVVYSICKQKKKIEEILRGFKRRR